jgi:hypothetical protein
VALHHLAAAIAELVDLAGKTIANVPATMFDSSAELLDIVAAGSPVMRTIRILGERRRGERHTYDGGDESYAMGHFGILRSISDFVVEK